MSKFRLLIIVCLLLNLFVCLGNARAEVEQRSNPNYLVLLVHGIGSNRSAFTSYGNLKSFLENDLGLEGYVWAYDFSDNMQSNSKNAVEFGDKQNGSTYKLDFETGRYTKYEGKCWLEQSRDDFIAWYTNKYGSSPEASQIPEKYIVIAHSMGGLGVREYINSSYYGGEIEKLITVDTPHLGADGAEWFKNFKRMDATVLKALFAYGFDNGIQYLLSVAPTILTTTLDNVYVSSAHYTTNFLSERITSAWSDVWKLKLKLKSNAGECRPSEIFNKFSLEADLPDNYLGESWDSFISGKRPIANLNLFGLGSGGVALSLTMFSAWDGTEAFAELYPDSEFINRLKNASGSVSSSGNVKYRLISATGVPTAHKGLIKSFYGLSPYAIGFILPYLGEFQGLPSEGTKAYAALLSVAVPGLMPLKSGSMLVAQDSSAGEGIKAFGQNTKRYEYQFKHDPFDLAATTAKDVSNLLKAIILLQAAFTGGATTPFIAQMYMIPTMGLSIAEMALLAEYEAHKFASRASSAS